MIRVTFVDGSIVEYPTATRAHHWEGEVTLLKESKEVPVITIAKLPEGEIAKIEDVAVAEEKAVEG